MDVLELEQHLELKLGVEFTAKFKQVLIRGDGTILIVD
jgi:hypothetical protein